MEAVNGFKTSIPDEEIALAIVDCGGTTYVAVFILKGFFINVVPTGRVVHWLQYITEDIYVSNVGVEQITLADGTDAAAVSVATEELKATNYQQKSRATCRV